MINPRSTLRLSPARRSRRGVALMMALLTLFLLISLAVPYSYMTSHQAAASKSMVYRREARNGANTSLALAKAELRRYHRLRQFANWVEMHRGVESRDPWSSLYDHRVDGLDRLNTNVADILRNEYMPVTGELNARNPQGNVWSARIEDEQGKININTAPASLLANIFGSAIVQETDNSGDGYDIVLQDGAENFPLADGPQLGYFVLRGVLISYTIREGNVFKNCRMVEKPIDALSPGALGRTRPGKPVPIFNISRNIVSNPEDLKWVIEGDLIMPVVAYTSAYWRLLGPRSSPLQDYSHVDQIREIAELALIEQDGASVDQLKPECFTPGQWVKARRYLTVHSRGPFNNGFGFAQRGGQARELNEEDPTDLQYIYADRYNLLMRQWHSANDPRQRGGSFRRGATIRVRVFSSDLGEPNTQDRYGMIVSGAFGMRVAAPQELVEEEPYSIVEMREITPININTASREVIVANLKGLRSGTNYLSAEDARLIADAILYLRYRDVAKFDPRFRKFDELIKPRGVSLEDDDLRVGVVRNAKDFVAIVRAISEGEIGDEGVNDDAANLLGFFLRSPYQRLSLSHAPFCYHSYGTYTIRGHSSRQLASGVQAARVDMSEVIESGTDVGERYGDEGLRWEWRDREYLVAQQEQGLGHVLRVSNRSVIEGAGKKPRVHGMVELPLVLDSQYSPPPSNVGSFVGRTSGNRIWNVNGRALASSSIQPSFARSLNLSLIADATGHVGLPTDSGDGTDVASLQAGSLEFWYQVPANVSSGDELVIFDMGLERNVNRLALIYGSAEFPSELALMMTDRTLQDAFSAVTMPLDSGRWRAGLWVFIRCSWNGMESGGLSLLVDSMARGGGSSTTSSRDVQVVNSSLTGADGEQTARLATNLGIGSTSISMTGVRGTFPDFGVVQIGSEAIEYSSNIGSVLSGLTRGARGTSATSSHPAGSVVSMFGYASTLLVANDAPYLFQSGASLTSAVDGHGRYRVVHQGSSSGEDAYLFPERVGPTVSVDPTRGTVQLTAIDGNSGSLPQMAVIYMRGPAWRRYSVEPLSGFLVPDYALPNVASQQATVTGGARGPWTMTLANIQEEYQVVQRVSGNSYRIVRRLTRNANGSLVVTDDPGWYFLAGPASTSNIDPAVLGGSWVSSGSVAIVASIHVGAGGQYFDPNGGSGRVQVAADSTDVRGAPDFPWITYNDIVIEGGQRLFAFTGGQLQSEANRVSTALVASETTNGAAIGFREWNGPNGLPHPLPAQRHVNQVFAMTGDHGLGDEVTLVYETINQGGGGRNTNLLKSQVRLGRVSGDRCAIWSDGPGSIAGPRLLRSYYANAAQGNGRLPMALQLLETKAVKFPEPGLPSGVPTRMRFGGPNHRGAASGGGRGRFDEMRHRRQNTNQQAIVGGVANNASSMLIYPRLRQRDRGLIKVGDEYVAYRSSRIQTIQFTIRLPNGTLRVIQRQSTRISGLVRGVLGTQARGHASGQLIQEIDTLPVAFPSGGIGATTPFLQMQSTQGMPPFGFLRAEHGNNTDLREMEIIGFNRRRGTTFYSGQFTPSGQGLFRGAFGTQARSWGATDVMVLQPVRHPDFMPKRMRAIDANVVAGTEVAHFEGREAFANAKLGLMRWSMDANGEGFPASDSDVPFGAKLVFRVNKDVDWSKTPVVVHGGGKPSRVRRSARNNLVALRRSGQNDPRNALYALEWTWGDSATSDVAGITQRDLFLDLAQLFPDAVQSFEWRLYFSYRDDVFYEGDYKRAPRFRGLTLDMESETRVLSHEERR